MTWTAVPAAVFADSVLCRIDNDIRFHLFRHLNGVRGPFRFRVLKIIAECPQKPFYIPRRRKIKIKDHFNFFFSNNLNLARKSSSWDTASKMSRRKDSAA
jgi:hypothetical protein